MKAAATGLLVAAAVLFIIARSNSGTTWGYVRAFSEAAMVGALADWFAVSALFRYPLGLKIPHTAIIPNRKDEIGRSLGEFVESEFMSSEIIGERVRAAKIGSRLGTWLSQPEHAKRAADGAADVIHGAIDVLDDRQVQDGLATVVEGRIRAVDVSPLVGRAIDLSIDGGHHQRLFDAVLSAVHGFMDDNKATFRQRLEQESPWWVPESIDDKVFSKIYDGVSRFVSDVGADPDHAVRHSVEARVHSFAERLKSDDQMIAKGEALKEEMLAHPDVRQWIESLWSEAKRGLLAATAAPDSELRQRLAATFAHLGQRIEHEPELQDKIDEWAERAVAYLLDNYRSEVSGLIESTVERWDGNATSQKLELQVGRDLQFIRINGTLVGGLAGLVIHAASELLF